MWWCQGQCVCFPALWPYLSFAQIPSLSECYSYISGPETFPIACLVANLEGNFFKDDPIGAEGVWRCFAFPTEQGFSIRPLTFDLIACRVGPRDWSGMPLWHWVPRLFVPAVSCPSCFYPNDEEFRFCQLCGYSRPRSLPPPSPPLKAPIDLKRIEVRWEALLRRKQPTSYCRQKSSLETELASFLQNL